MKKSYLVLHVAVILSGFTGMFGKLISLNEGLLVWYRLLFTSICLFFIIKLFKISRDISLREKFSIGKVGILITIFWLLFYASIKYSNISIGVVCYTLTSLFTAIFDPLLNKKKLVVAELLLSLLPIVGITLIFSFDADYHLGIILGVISSAFATIYTIYNERLVKKYDSVIINYYQMIGGTLGLGIGMPIYLRYFYASSVIPSLKDTLYLLILSIICTVGMYVLFAESLKKIPVFTVNLSFNLEPIYAIIIAFLFFDESKQMHKTFYLGLLLVGVSIFLQTIISIRNKPITLNSKIPSKSLP